jgi:hypothetical protein
VAERQAESRTFEAGPAGGRRREPVQQPPPPSNYLIVWSMVGPGKGHLTDVPQACQGQYKEHFLGKLVSRLSFPGFPGIGFYFINSPFVHFLEQFSIHCLNFKHYCFKCDANHLFGDLFSSHNNLALKCHISDVLIFRYFLTFIKRNISREFPEETLLVSLVKKSKES